MKSYGMRMHAHEHAKLMRLGAARWIRQMIREAPEPVALLRMHPVDKKKLIAADIREAKDVARSYGITASRVYHIRQEAKIKGWPVAVFEKTPKNFKNYSMVELAIAHDERPIAEVARIYGVTEKRVQALRYNPRLRQMKKPPEGGSIATP